MSDPTKTAAADAAANAAAYGARTTYARGFEDGQAAEKTRADDAEEACALHRENYLTVAAQRDAATARAEKAEAAQDALGIQLAAQSERLRLAMACVDCVRGALVRDDGIWTTTMRIAAIRALAALDAVPGDVLAPMWGVEMRNGGWLSTEVMKAGNGSSCAVDKAHRFATQAEAEKEAAEWSWAGGAAKRVDADLFGRGVPPSPAGVSGQPHLLDTTGARWVGPDGEPER
jgi:hypothetical protein